MSTPLRITSTLEIMALLDIQHEDIAQSYREGVPDGMRHCDELVSLTSLLTCLKGAITFGVFDGQHRDDARTYIQLDRMHGGIPSQDASSWRHDPDEIWQYTLATLLCELSGLLFPLTQQERAGWEEEEQRVQAEIARLHAQHCQPDTEPLDPVPVVMYPV